MTPTDLGNIHTKENSCRDKLPCARYWYFHLLMEKPLGPYFPVWSPYYEAAQCNQKTPIPVCSRCQVRSEKAKKDKYQHKSQFIWAQWSARLIWAFTAFLTSIHNQYFYFPLLSYFCINSIVSPKIIKES